MPRWICKRRRDVAAGFPAGCESCRSQPDAAAIDVLKPLPRYGDSRRINVRSSPSPVSVRINWMFATENARDDLAIAYPRPEASKPQFEESSSRRRATNSYIRQGDAFGWKRREAAHVERETETHGTGL